MEIFGNLMRRLNSLLSMAVCKNITKVFPMAETISIMKQEELAEFLLCYLQVSETVCQIFNEILIRIDAN